jgi:hypothetical protein
MTAEGIFPDIGAEVIEVGGVSHDGIVEPGLPAEGVLVEVPPDALGGFRFESADYGTEGLGQKVFGSVGFIRCPAVKNQEAVDVIRHDHPFVKGYPRMIARDLFPFRRHGFSHRR